MGKRIISVFVLLAILTLLCACSIDKYPRLSIQRTSNRYDNIDLPLRKGFEFAEDAYEIVETETGYDIIVHVVEGMEK